MTSRWASWAAALWSVTALAKLAQFVFQYRLGALGGPTALGALVSVSTAFSLLGATLHGGLVDWALFWNSEQEKGAPRAEAGAGHALFLTSALVTLALVGLGSPWLGGERDLVPFTLFISSSLFLTHVSAFTHYFRRGEGKPAIEAIAVGAGAIIVGVGALLAQSVGALGVVMLIAGACLCVPGVAALGTAALRPRWVSPRLVLQQSLPYLGVSLPAALLWSMGALVARVSATTAEVGVLQAAQFMLNGSLFGAALLGSLLVPLTRSNPRLAGALSLGGPAALTVASGILAWLTRGLISAHFHVDLAAMERVLTLAIAVSLATTLAMTWVPLATAERLAETRRALFWGLAAAAIAGAFAPTSGALAGLVSIGAGEGVVILLLLPGRLRALRGTEPA